jgi:hypothetical protein
VIVAFQWDDPDFSYVIHTVMLNSVSVDGQVSVLILGNMIQYSDNSGTSLTEAVKITGAASHFESVDAEYRYLAQRYGTRNVDFIVEEQHLICDEGRHYDILKITQRNGERVSVFFDITESYSKFVINPQ